jgi:hypothetical protein
VEEGVLAGYKIWERIKNHRCSVTLPKISLMEKLVGRYEEIGILEAALSSSSAELIAVYGRRRVGKTFLVRNVYAHQLVFEFSGVHNAKMTDQLQNFSHALQHTLHRPRAKRSNYGCIV